jgi:hypothetical protein
MRQDKKDTNASNLQWRKKEKVSFKRPKYTRPNNTIACFFCNKKGHVKDDL